MTISQIWTSVWASALISHLWQSTAIALLAWLLTITLRNNSARVRYAIWLLASIKFLIPFSFMTRIGSHWARPVVDTHAERTFFFIEEFSRPIRQAPASVPPAASVQPGVHALPIALGTLLAIWLFGCIVLLVKWISGWRRAARIVRRAEPVFDGREFHALRRAERRAGFRNQIPLVLSAGETEPGVFGAVHPVLLWPSGLSERLDDTQIEAIMAHEIEHVQRRDNLTAAIHALVEALFWFHPMVRWMSARMNEERERACDEKVIEQNARPEAYAESILKVCAFCMEPPTPCVAGVSGADLKDRILRIMTRRRGVALSTGRKFILSAAAIMTLVLPVGFGVLHGQTSPPRTSTSSADIPKFDVASIKTYKADEGGMMVMMSPDGVSLRGMPLRELVHSAFGVEEDRVVGEPDWVKSSRFDIDAKVSPEDAPKLRDLKMQQRNAMMLQLLVDRFNLKYHHERRDLPLYALVVAKGGPQLTESKPGEGMPGPDEHIAPPEGSMRPPDGPPREGNRPVIGEGMRMRPGSIQSSGGSISFLVHALSGTLGRTVVDKTGLTGNYDFSLNWTPDESMRNILGAPGGSANGNAPPDAGGPTLFTALEEQLGLKLESRKATVDVIVIDHIDQPTAN